MKAWSHLFRICVLLSLAGCSAAATLSSSSDLTTLCEQEGLQCDWDAVTQVVTLRYGDRQARALIGSDRVVVGRRHVPLSAPVKGEAGRIVLPPDFKTAVVVPLKTASMGLLASDRLTRPYRIVLDPGHGGKDPGAISPRGVQEKDVVLDIALKLKPLLEQEGFDVLLTRDRDVFISLAERTEFATRAKADLFISLHANANPSRRIKGAEVYTLRPLSHEEMNEEQRRKNLRLLFHELRMESNNDDLNRIVEDILFTIKKTESPRLAYSLERGLHVASRTGSRGVKEAGFFVVRNNLMPSVLVEVGYLTHPRGESLLMSAEYRRDLAVSLAEGIVAYVSQGDNGDF